MSFRLGFLDSAAGSLPYVRRGPAGAPQLLVIQPLFEERNRLRRLLADVTRRLADAGIASWLFDLPGTGDSDLPDEAASWPAWRESLRLAAEHVAASGGDPYIFSVRGGCLLDDVEAEATYRFAPVAGDRLLRDMLRARAAGSGGKVADLEAAIERGETLDLAGYRVSAPLARALALAEALPAQPLRTAVLGDGAADIVLDGPPLWRQAEPIPAPGLAAALAADLAQWIASCAAR